MGVSQLCKCVCLTVLVVAVAAQIRRPLVKAPAASDSDMNAMIGKSPVRVQCVRRMRFTSASWRHMST